MFKLITLGLQYSWLKIIKLIYVKSFQSCSPSMLHLQRLERSQRDEIIQDLHCKTLFAFFLFSIYLHENIVCKNSKYSISLGMLNIWRHTLENTLF